MKTGEIGKIKFKFQVEILCRPRMGICWKVRRIKKGKEEETNDRRQTNVGSIVCESFTDKM